MGRTFRITAAVIWGFTVAVMIGLALYVSGLPYKNTTLSFQDVVPVTNGWINEDTGKKITDTGLLVPAGQSVSISHYIAPQKGPYYFFFQNPALEVHAYVEDREVISLGITQPHRIGSDSLYEWAAVPVAESDFNKSVRLVFTNHGRTHPIDMQTMSTGSLDELNYHLWQSESADTLETGFIAVIALLLLIYWIVLLRFGLRRYRRAILYLALLSLAAFAWDLANNHLVQFLNVSPSLRSQLSYFSFYILPLFILLFFSQLFQITGSRKQQNLLILCAAGYGAEVCLILFLYAFNILHLSVTLKAVHITDILLLLLVLLLCLREYRRTDDAMMKWSLLAFLLLFIGCTLNFVMFYTTTRSRGFSSGFRRGTMAFLLVLCVTVVRASMVEFGDVLSLEKYKHMAYIDHITGGNTKACFFEHLKDEAGHEAHWFLCVNFIGFKVCNEVLGFDDGDQLLSDLYKRTETFLEPGEIICNADNARFYLWLHDGTEDRLSERCVKIRKELPKCLDKYTSKLILDVNFYGYHAAPDEKEVNSIQNLAMMAYENPRAEYRKEASCWIYREECRRFSLYEKELEGSLKEGIENREFLVYLQPKCDPRTGVLKEAEALVRWQHPKYGMIPPDHYIDLFEKDGRIFELDLYVFRRACEYISSWEKQGVRNPPVISANISKAAIRQDAFFSRYLEIIRETGVSTKYIQFEITESMSFDDKDQIKQLIRDIHTAGATCAMDDFGKSYSNLAILEELDFDVVKMDADIFRSGYPVVEDRRNFVTELIRFLKSIGKQVVAEGIETSTQVEALADSGCDLIQGYYFAKPLCFTDFEKFRSEHGQN